MEAQALQLSSSLTPVPNPYEIELDQIDVSDPRIVQQDCWPAYFERLRTERPVHYVENELFGGFWSVTRYEDIVYVDCNPKLFSSEPTIAIGDAPEDFSLEMFIAMDGDKHIKQRKAVQGVVAPKNLLEMEPLIRSRVQQILDNLPLNQPFDWVDKVSIELTSQMLTTLFDHPFEDRRQLVYWSDLAVSNPNLTGAQTDDVTEAARQEELRRCGAHFMALWKDKEAKLAAGEAPGFDLISMMLSNEATKDCINKPLEFIGNIVLLLVGGNDTTRNSISCSVNAMHEYPAEFAKLKNDPTLIPNMVSEVIRWQTPLTHMRRVATQDTELAGQHIKKGQKVVMWYLSGNRDDNNISNPNAFRIDRADARKHLSFGFGVHRCMGNRLAEMQLRILWEELLPRFERIEVIEQPTRICSNFVRGFKELPVILHPKT